MERRTAALPLAYRVSGWLIAPLLLFIPLLFISHVMFFGNRDAVFYINILTAITSHAHAGDFLPRWLADANGGVGSPVMLFYAPLGYLLTALITWPLSVFSPLSAGTEFIMGIYSSQVVAGITSYAWLSRRFSSRVAFAGSLLFILLPYKLTYIYDHMNLAQLWALAFLPLWMTAAEKIVSGNTRAIAGYALCFTAVYYIHPLTVIAFAGVPFCYVLWFGRKTWLGRYMALAASCVLAAGLCSLHAFPQYAYLSWISPQKFLSGRMAWRINLYHIDTFLCAYYGMIAALVTYAASRVAADPTDDIKTTSRFWAVMLAAVAFMTLPASSFLWQRLTLLQYLQFPAARLHSVALMAVIYFISLWLSRYRRFLPLGPLVYRRESLAFLIVIFSLATISRIMASYAIPNNITQTYIDAVRADEMVLPPEYKTRWGCVDVDKTFDRRREGRMPARVSAGNSDATATVSKWAPPYAVIFDADVALPDTPFLVAQCYLPLWKAIDEKGRELTLMPSNPDGLLQLKLPPGHHQVRVSLPLSPLEREGRWITLLSLMIILAILLQPLFAKKQVASREFS